MRTHNELYAGSAARPMLSVTVLLIYALVATASATDRLVPRDYTTIQSAVNAAASGDRILISGGIYTEQVSIASKAITVALAAIGDEVILSRAGLGGSVFIVSGAASQPVIIDGMTIEGATTSGITVQSGASVVIRDCLLRNCRSILPRGGGGVFVDAANLVVETSSFDSCSHVRTITGEAYPSETYSRSLGGAILIQNGAAASISGSTFGGCAAEMSASFSAISHTGTKLFQALGGAIAADQSTLSISECTFDNCRVRAVFSPGSSCPGGAATRSADAFGGAIALLTNCEADVRDSHFLNTSAVWTASARLSMPAPWNYSGASWTMRAGGGYIAASSIGGASSHVSLSISDCTFDSPRMLAEWNTTGWCTSGGAITVASGHLSGGALELTAPASLWTMSGIRFVSGTMATSSPGGWPIPFTLTGRVARIATATGTTTQIAECEVDGAGGSGSADASLVVTGSGSANCSHSRFVGSGVPAIRLTGGAAVIHGCQLRNGSGSPLIITGSATAMVSDSLICENSPNSFSGDWSDAGGNWFLTDCASLDCDISGIDDRYELAVGLVEDCNSNDVPDTCDVSKRGASTDYNQNGVPDDCECLPDFNQDGVVDGSDLGILLIEWNRASSVLELDGISPINGGDIGVLLLNWGPCS